MEAYRHILVPTNLAAENHPVIERARELAGHYQARVTLMHVVEFTGNLGFEGDLPVPEDLELDRELVDIATGQLQATAREFGLDEQSCVVEIGVPKHEIVRTAAELAVDLIVIGSHGRHGLQLILGSTANGVLHLAKCDVLAVRIKA